jgi:hypothetical protein
MSMEIDHRRDEDLERMPDGIPHAVVGLTAFYAVVLAIAIVALLSNASHGIAIVLATIASPLIVWRLACKAERERDVVHPSR